MKRRIESGQSFPERFEQHAPANWFDLGFNHKTTTTMGLLVPLATKEVYPGEKLRLANEIKLMFAPLYLPIFHQCYFTCDWFYVTYDQLWNYWDNNWKTFISEDPNNATLIPPKFNYLRADAVFTDGIINYMGFNAPPTTGTLRIQQEISALPPVAYAKIWNEYFRNDQIQADIFRNATVPLTAGDNTNLVQELVPNLRALRRNWPRDYYTSATPTPQLGENVLIPMISKTYENEIGDIGFGPSTWLRNDGVNPPDGSLDTTIAGTPPKSFTTRAGSAVYLDIQSTAAPIRDLRYAQQMTEFLERHLRAGDRYNDFVMRNFGYNPNPLYIDRPVWIGGYTGDVFISEVLATAEVGAYTVGEYAGQALARDNTPTFTYTVPDYGLVMCLFTCYPKASYYTGTDRMWSKKTKMEYMWEQFALIGDQPILNKEVWFSWYDADEAWNNEIFGYLPQYTWEKYSNDIVSGQMRTIWEGFHLGRKFDDATDVVLNSAFLECRPDIGRVFVVDTEAGEHEVLIHAYNKIEVLRKLPRNGLPQT